MSDPLPELLARLEQLLAEVEQWPEPARSQCFELLDGVDAVHRWAIEALAATLGAQQCRRLAEGDPALRWLLEAYGVAPDSSRLAEEALAAVAPYVDSHGGRIELLGVAAGVVRVRLGGSCAGCDASAQTLRDGVELALAERMPGFRALEVEEDRAPRHPPPGPTLLQITPRPAS